jgi:Fic family protein
MANSIGELNLEKAVYYHSNKFPPTQLRYAELMTPLVQATDALARYDQMLKNMHNSEILLAPLRNQEAVISSRMEGTVSTMDEILKYEADFDGDSEESSSMRSEVIETILYQRALKAAQKAMEEGQPLSEFLIRAAHGRLLSFGRGATKSPGQYKSEQNYLADRTMRNILFVPIAPEHLAAGMEKLFAYLNSSTDTVLIKAAISHIEFEALHPFKDGNGRIGRMIITLLLWHTKAISAPHFYISGFLEENKDAYIDTMRQVSATDDWTSWCKFFLQAVEKQAVRNLVIAESISELYERMKTEFSNVLSSKWSVNALDFVFTNPFFRNSKFRTHSGIPSPTAARLTKALQEKGLLTVVEEAAGQRAALYSFEPLMRIVRV